MSFLFEGVSHLFLLEAKKKKKEKEKLRLPPQVEASGNKYSIEHDFMGIPLGPFNRYAQQGAVNYGPDTGAPSAWDSVSVLVSKKKDGHGSAWESLGDVWAEAEPPGKNFVGKKPSVKK